MERLSLLLNGETAPLNFNAQPCYQSIVSRKKALLNLLVNMNESTRLSPENTGADTDSGTEWK